MMSMRNDRTKRRRVRRHRSELDWFAEDPWGEPEHSVSIDGLDDWPALWGSTDDGFDDDDPTEDDWDDDAYGPIRPRRKRRYDAR